MSKKHFIALADSFRQTRPLPTQEKGVKAQREYLARLSQWGQDMNRIASVCLSASPNFDYQRFVNACQDSRQRDNTKARTGPTTPAKARLDKRQWTFWPPVAARKM